MQVRELENPGFVYAQCMDLMAKLAAKGLIHCDFNEFNLLVRGCLALSCFKLCLPFGIFQRDLDSNEG